MESLGTRLRREREAQNLTIEDVAQRTRIKALYLEGIESDDGSVLPGGFFHRSFVRQYARALGLPETFGQVELESLVREEEASEREKSAAPREREYRVAPVPMEGVLPSTETRKWIAGLVVLGTVLVLCSITYALWERFRTRATDGLEGVAQSQPAKKVEPVSVAPPASTPPVPVPESGTGGAAEPAASGPATPAATAESQPAAPLGQSVAAPVVAPPAPVATGSVRVTLRATEDVWVDAASGGRRLYSNLLRAGASETLSSDEPVRVRLGNAGGVEIEHNGAAIPAAGPKGAVRTLTFRPDGYEGAAAAVKP